MPKSVKPDRVLTNVERCRGGLDELQNLQLLCPTCHEEEHYNRRQMKDEILARFGDADCVRGMKMYGE